MLAAKLFQLNEILTLASGLAVVAMWFWMKWKVPEHRMEHFNSPGPLLRVVEAYRQSPRADAEKKWVSTIFRAALIIFVACAVISFWAGFVAAVRGPAKLPQF